jgi:hypothetical protein
MGATTLRLSGVRAGRRCGRSQRYGITCLKRWQRFHNAPCRMAGRRVRGAQGALIGFSQETIKPGTQIAPRDCAPNFLVAVLVPYHVDQHSGVPLSRSRKVDPAVILWNLSPSCSPCLSLPQAWILPRALKQPSSVCPVEFKSCEIPGPHRTQLHHEMSGRPALRSSSICSGEVSLLP